MPKLIHKKTKYSRIIEKNKKLFRIRTLDVGRKGYLRLRIAFAKNDRARKLIKGYNSVVISLIYPKGYKVKRLRLTNWR